MSQMACAALLSPTDLATLLSLGPVHRLHRTKWLFFGRSIVVNPICDFLHSRVDICTACSGSLFLHLYDDDTHITSRR